MSPMSMHAQTVKLDNATSKFAATSSSQPLIAHKHRARGNLNANLCALNQSLAITQGSTQKPGCVSLTLSLGFCHLPNHGGCEVAPSKRLSCKYAIGALS